MSEAPRTIRRAEVVTLGAWAAGFAVLVASVIADNAPTAGEYVHYVAVWGPIIRGVAACTFVGNFLGYVWASNTRQVLGLDDPRRERAGWVVALALLGVVGSAFLFLFSFLLVLPLS